MSGGLTVQEILAKLETRAAFHEEQGAFHGQQEEHHREQRAFHAAELRQVRQHLVRDGRAFNESLYRMGAGAGGP